MLGLLGRVVSRTLGGVGIAAETVLTAAPRAIYGAGRLTSKTVGLRAGLGTLAGYGVYKSADYFADKLEEARDVYGYKVGGGITGLIRAAGFVGGGATMVRGAAGMTANLMTNLSKVGMLSAGKTGLLKGAGAVRGFPGEVLGFGTRLTGKALRGTGKILGRAAIAPLMPAYDLARWARRGFKTGSIGMAAGMPGAMVGTRMFGYGAVGAFGLATMGGLFSDKAYYQSNWGSKKVSDIGIVANVGRSLLGQPIVDPTRQIVAESQVWDPSKMRSPRRQGMDPNTFNTKGLVQAMHLNR